MKLGTKEIVAVAIGSALFGFLMVFGGIQVFTNTKLTTAYIVPVIVGAFFGVIPAALVGFIGNFIADTIGAWGYWIDWTIGNAFACFFIGSLSLYGANIKKGVFEIKHAVIFSIISVIGIAISFGIITPIVTTLLYGGEIVITYAQAQAAVISNSIIVLGVGNPILFLLASRYKKENNLTEEE